MGGIANGFAQLFKAGRKRIGNAIDNYLLDAESQKAISDEVEKKFQPMIDRARKAESKRAANIKDLGDKLNESKKALQDAKNDWQQKYDSALANAKAQRQTDISNYEAELKRYNDVLDNANQGRQDILDQLYQKEATYNPYKTIYTDVKTGVLYRLNPRTGKPENLDTYYQGLTKKEQRAFDNDIQNYDHRLYDKDSNHVINVFNTDDVYNYDAYTPFTNYLNRVRASKDIDLRNADSKIKKANADLTTWNTNNTRPTDWDDTVDLTQFKTDFTKNNSAKPKEYSFNGQNYSKESELDKAYKDALAHEQKKQGIDSRIASSYITKRDAEIAKRIQDAKDVKKAKLALGAGVGAGALFAGAKAMYGGDDTDTGDTPDNIDNTADTYTGEPDPDLNIENTPEGKAALNGKSLIDTDFDPDIADALASAAYDKGVEDGNSIRSSGDLGNNIGASTRGHTIDDRLYELLKAMKDPYKADAIANYIYSRHGDDLEVQRLGWRGWLNKYYGDSLRSIMNIDPSGYKGMHVSGGL